jgi:hypothetical protein
MYSVKLYVRVCYGVEHSKHLKCPVTGGYLIKRLSGHQSVNDLYSSPNTVWVIKSGMRWRGHVARMGGRRGIYRVLMEKSEGMRPPGRPKRRWKENIKMYLQEAGFGGTDWIDLAQDKDTCEYGHEPSGSIKCREFD